MADIGWLPLDYQNVGSIFRLLIGSNTHSLFYSVVSLYSQMLSILVHNTLVYGLLSLSLIDMDYQI